ncbi:hypothetical protein ACF1AJ_04625 [Leifsonia sp. NPDC014704]|uniref:hypothetical protein n=1 Tax=Leifsonia sp. NPDC014704 TaxID=3364123 RepID=UPI0036F46E6F
MHPLFFWSISVSELAERQREEALLRAQRDSGVVQPPPLTRDDRWRAAIQRWAAAEPPQSVTPAPSVPAPSAAPRFGRA